MEDTFYASSRVMLVSLIINKVERDNLYGLMLLMLLPKLVISCYSEMKA